MSNLSAAAPNNNDQKRSTGSLPTPKMRRGLKAFLADTGREMKKVTWPTKAETNRLTFVVLVVTFILVVVLSVLSYFFELVVNFITKGAF